jgi:hypothetical protein
MSETDHGYASTTAVIKRAVGNGSATMLLDKIVYFCSLKKGGVMHEGRKWSYRQQKEWFTVTGLPPRTGKRVWAQLVAGGYILAEERYAGRPGDRRMVMHVALTDKTLDMLEGASAPNLQISIMKAKVEAVGYAKTLAKSAADTTKAALYAAAVQAGDVQPITFDD